MEIPNTHIDLIEAYLAGRLQDEELQTFEARLGSEPDLARQLELYQAGQEAIELFAEEKLKAQFRDLYKSGQTNQASANEAIVKPLFGGKLWYAVAAAAVVLILAIIGYQRFNGGPVDPATLYAQNYELPPLNERGDTNLDPLEAASALMSQGDFFNALPQLEALLADDTFQRLPAAYYRIGLCQMELSEWDHAVDAFSQIDPNSPLVHQGRWYMALSYLQLNELPQAQTQLQLILENSRDKTLKEKAQGLLDSL